MNNLNIPLNQPWLSYRSNNPSLSVRMLRLLLTQMDFLDPIKARKRVNMIARLAKIKMPANVKIEPVRIAKCRATRIMPENASEEKVILCLHGGGYIAGDGAYCNVVAANMAKYTGWQALALDYRLAPENPYPAALEDAFAVYNELVQQGIKPSNIVLYGDSSGGGLCLSLCHKIKDSRIDLPGAIIALSPWTDLGASGESHKTNIKKDPILLFVNGGPGFHYVQGENVENPYISPAFGDFTGFPKTLIIVGEDEILLSDSLTVGEKAHQQGVDVQVHLWKGMMHVFPVMSRLLPESKKAMQEISAFLNNL